MGGERRLHPAAKAILLLAAAAPVVWAETVELTVYYPAPGSGNYHVNSLTVGTPYMDVAAGDGRALVFDQVGIGTPSPVSSAFLDIAGDANVGGGVPRQVWIRDASAGTLRFYLGYDTAANYGSLQARDEGGVGLSRPLLLQKLGGNVGIGLTNPSVRLEVAQGGAIRVGDGTLSSGRADWASFGANAWYDGTDWQILDAAKRSGRLLLEDERMTFSATQTAGGTDWQPRFSVAPGGNVGIGTSDPKVLLDVSGDGGAILVPRTDPVTRAAAWNPAGVDGMIYYNSAAGKFRAYESGWKDAISSSGGSANGSYTGNGVTQTLSVGFPPKLVFITHEGGQYGSGLSVKTPEMPGDNYIRVREQGWSSSAVAAPNSDVWGPLTLTGLRIQGSSLLVYGDNNEAGLTYHWMAIG